MLSSSRGTVQELRRSTMNNRPAHLWIEVLCRPGCGHQLQFGAPKEIRAFTGKSSVSDIRQDVLKDFEEVCRPWQNNSFHSPVSPDWCVFADWGRLSADVFASNVFDVFGGVSNFRPEEKLCQAASCSLDVTCWSVSS